jgi:iron complex outermembrane receptor protein
MNTTKQKMGRRMMTRVTLKTNGLIGASVIALAIGMASPAAAQETPATPAPAAADQEPDAKDIVVTGFRSSLANAINIKRQTAGVVDVIKAQDIAAFPDQNLAESLQRIPGVAITRVGGEGRNISVRGLGPDYTRVRLNGMEALATSGGSDSGGAVGNNRGRGFDFNIFASELFNALTVHKTGSADIEEGSLGATVDLTTSRPFDYSKPEFVVSTQGSYNDMSKKFDPRIAALATKTFMDGKLGVLLSVAYNERHALEELSGTTRWGPGGANGGFNAASTVPGTSLATLNSNTVGTAIFHPRNPSYNSYDENEKRLGITGSIQFRPTDQTLISFNGMYGRLQSSRTERLLQAISFSRSGSTGKSQTIIRNGAVDGDHNLVYGVFDNVDMRSQSSYTEFTTTFQQYTLDFSQKFGDRFKITGLAGYAKSVFDEPIGTVVTFDHLDTQGYSYDYRDNPNVPKVTVGFDPTQAANWATIPGFSALNLNKQKISNKFVTGKLEADWEPTDSIHIKGGADYRKFDFASFQAIRVQAETSVPVMTAQQLADTSYVFSGYGGSLGLPAGSPSSWLVPDIQKYASLFNIYSNTGLFELGSTQQSEARGGNFSVTEKDTGAYLQATLDTRLGGMRVRGDAGLRYFHTNQLSNGYAAVGNSIQLVNAERSYDDFLPSMNLVVELTDKFLVRFGAAKTIARPSLASLTPGGDISVQGGNRSFSSGNPDLRPTSSKNLDLSLEWYPTGGAIYSVGLFYKDISTFVQTLRQTIPFNQLGLPNELLNGTIAVPTDDFDVTQPVNSSGGTLKGLEVNFQQPLRFLPGFLGNFGVLLNYTYVDSNIKYLTSTTAGAPTVDATLVGLSKHAANGTLYYETKAFTIRGSVSYRSGYFTQVPGRNSNFVEGTNSTLNVDARASYNISKNFQVSLEAINLTNQPEDRYVDYSNRPWIYSSTGRTVSLGLRYTY